MRGSWPTSGESAYTPQPAVTNENTSSLLQGRHEPHCDCHSRTPRRRRILCAGTLIRLKKEHGWTIHVATMTPGDCGSVEYPPDEIARIRQRGGKAAADVIGAAYHCVEENATSRVDGVQRIGKLEKVTRLINAVKASVVFTHSPDDYHFSTTSRRASSCVAATFAAPIPNFLHGRHIHPPLEHIPHALFSICRSRWRANDPPSATRSCRAFRMRHFFGD